MHPINRKIIILAISSLATGLSASPGSGPQPIDSPPEIGSKADATVEGADGLFLSGTVTTRVGKPCAIPIRVGVGEEAPTLSTTPAGILEILRQPDTPVEAPWAFVRVKGIQPGTAALKSDDGRRVKVEVVACASDPLDRLRRPVIFAPVQGSYVWGTFTIGVELLADDIEHAYLLENLKLTLPGQREVTASGATSPEQGPMHLVRFDVNADALPPGPHSIEASLALPDGSKRTSDLLRVNIIRPSEKELIAGECEAYTEVEPPERFRAKGKKLRVGTVADASGGRYISNYSNRPVWALPFDAGAGGKFQVLVRARGDIGANTYPTVGLYVNNDGNPATSTRIVDQNWHRVPVGRAVNLDAGEQILSVVFENDFHVRGRSDRNLYLDRFEVARVDRGSGQPRPRQGSGTKAGSGTKDEAGDAPVMAPGNGEPGKVSLSWVESVRNPLVTGRVTLRAECRWDNPGKQPAPVVTLLANGVRLARQRSAHPVFVVERNALHEGENVVSIVAHDASGRPANELEQRLVVKGPVTAPETANTYHRYSVYDPAWSTNVAEHISEDDFKKFAEKASFYSNTAMTLDLPDSLEGSYELLVECQGQKFRGPPIFGMSLSQTGQPDATAELEVKHWMHNQSAGEFTFVPGRKSLTLSFANDLYEKDKGDRNVYLGSVTLRPKYDRADDTPPVVDVLYPVPGQPVYGADVLIAEAYDDRVLEWADLLVDGKSTGMRLTPRYGLGRLVFPLSARGLEPGTHRVQVRARDQQGNVSDSATLEISVPADAPAEMTGYERALHLLNRFAYGPEADELADLLLLGEEAWLRHRLSPVRPKQDSELAMQRGLTRAGDGTKEHLVVQGALQHMLSSNNPVYARYAMWAQNHFSTWLRKTGASSKWGEHLAFYESGPAPFLDLLTVSATSPAMLFYLDQSKSFAGRLNENYAREIMELHTLGVDGGYSQQDVTELARLLTGWTGVEESNREGVAKQKHRSFRYDPAVSDTQHKRFLGLPFASTTPAQRFDEVRRALEILAAHPSTAEYISRKLAEHYVAVPAPEDLVRDLTAVFLESGGDARALLMDIAEHPGFWETATTSRLASPMDYGLKLARYAPDTPPYELASYLGATGTALFDRAMPDGYPEDDLSFANSNALLQRWKFAQKMSWRMKKELPPPWRGVPKEDREEWGQRVVDYMAIRLTGRLLGETSNRAALDFLAASPAKGSDSAAELMTLVCQMPEVNVR